MFHSAGYKIILITTMAVGAAFVLIDKFVTDLYFNRGVSFLILLAYLFILQQYRNSKRTVNSEENAFLSPIDGVLNSVERIPATNLNEDEYLLSFYVSPFRFHSVRAPFPGIVKRNDSTIIPNSNMLIQTVEIEYQERPEYCTRIEIYPGKFSQNAILYPQKNSTILQGEEIGFINFDAKVTLTVATSSELKVKINDRVKAGEHLIARI